MSCTRKSKAKRKELTVLEAVFASRTSVLDLDSQRTMKFFGSPAREKLAYNRVSVRKERVTLHCLDRFIYFLAMQAYRHMVALDTRG